MDSNWVEQQKIWIKAQKNCVDHMTRGIEYCQIEMDLHERSIQLANELRQHYLEGIEKAEADLEKYLKENSAP